MKTDQIFDIHTSRFVRKSKRIKKVTELFSKLEHLNGNVVTNKEHIFKLQLETSALKINAGKKHRC